RRMTPMYGLIEVDVTNARQILARHDPPSSMTAFVVASVARAAAAHRKRRRPGHPGGAALLQRLQAAWPRRVQGLGGLSARGSQSSGFKPWNAAWNRGSQGKRPFLSAHTTCRYGGLTKP